MGHEYPNPEETQEERMLSVLIAKHIMGWTLDPDNIESVKKVAIEFSKPLFTLHSEMEEEIQRLEKMLATEDIEDYHAENMAVAKIEVYKNVLLKIEKSRLSL